MKTVLMTLILAAGASLGVASELRAADPLASDANAGSTPSGGSSQRFWPQAPVQSASAAAESQVGVCTPFVT